MIQAIHLQARLGQGLRPQLRRVSGGGGTLAVQQRHSGCPWYALGDRTVSRR
jgi:hypothetical protein